MSHGPSLPQLPILLRRDDIVEAIRSHQVCIICGETGSGKTTQLPQICMQMGLGERGLIGHTQPRRLAARSVAQRIAEEMRVSLGDEVGVKIRFGDQTSRRTRIKLMTDGILLAETQGDRLLRQYSTLIIDEAHERSMNIDFLLGYIKGLLPRRPDLKLIITSATINPREFSDYFGGQKLAPVLEVSGRMYPVEVRYSDAEGRADAYEAIQGQEIVDAVEVVTSPLMESGDVLIFLPGEKDIRLAMTALRRAGLSDLELLPLYSRLTDSEQDRIFKRPSAGSRRVILATNVAETSLTVPGIRYVIDCGLVRESRYDPQLRVQKLPIVNVSQASAKQRSGRCGRVSAGLCLRLYSKADFDAFAVFTRPEILRTNLAGVILQMRSLGLGNIEKFDFVQRPDDSSIIDGYSTLHELQALTAPDCTGELTPIGERLAKIPADPKIGRMLIAAEVNGCLPEVLVLAAALSIQDPRDRPMARQREADTAHLTFFNETSDFLVLLNIWDQYQHARARSRHADLFAWCRDRYLSVNRMREWEQTHRQLQSIVGETAAQDDASDLNLSDEDLDEADGGASNAASTRPLSPKLADSIHRSLLTGLLSNLCCREEGASTDVTYRGSRGNKISIFPGSVLFKKGPRWMMASELVQTTRLYARTCAKIEPQWVEELAQHVMVSAVTDPHFDKDLGAAVAWERVSLAGAVIVPRRKVPLFQHDADAARTLFIRHGLLRGEAKLPVAFMRPNAEAIAQADTAVAKLRSPEALESEEAIEGLISNQIPSHVHDAATFAGWLESGGNVSLAVATASQRLTAPARTRLTTQVEFPNQITLASCDITLEYALEPGKERDGLTFVVRLEHLNDLSSERLEWLVPGMLPELIAAAVKALPKQHRSQLEAAALANAIDARMLAPTLTQMLSFGEGSLAQALSKTVLTLFDCKIDPDVWPMGERSVMLPTHLQPRLEVVDHAGREVGVSRVIGELRTRLAPRVAKAMAAVARNQFRQEGLVSWTFGPLVSEVVAGESPQTIAYPAIIDRVESVSLTLFEQRREADAATYFGIRRLFALACESELKERCAAMPLWSEMLRYFAPLGTSSELADSLSCVVCDRVFLWNQAPITTPDAFEARRDEQWGRLGQAVVEVGGSLHQLLDARFKVAARFAGGTPRLWAPSMADMREQSAYLMPLGFLKRLRWENLRHLPRYVEAIRQRLFSLREDGSGVETKALAELAPRWKRFTGWVAAQMSAERAAAAAAGGAPVGTALRQNDPDQVLIATGRAKRNGKPSDGLSSASNIGSEKEASAASTRNPGNADLPPHTMEIQSGLKNRTALPGARRAAPTINADAGDWAAQPGVLLPAIERYRWLLEEYRLTLFAPTLSLGRAMTAVAVDEAWAKVVREVKP